MKNAMMQLLKNLKCVFQSIEINSKLISIKRKETEIDKQTHEAKSVYVQITIKFPIQIHVSLTLIRKPKPTSTFSGRSPTLIKLKTRLNYQII